MLRKKLAKFLLSIAVVGVGSGSTLGYQAALANEVVAIEVKDVNGTMTEGYEIVEDKLASMPTKTLADELGEALVEDKLD